MKPMSGKELARLLERHGWELLRINGSHHIYGKPGSPVGCALRTKRPGTVRIAYPTNPRHLLKQAELSEHQP